MDMPKHQRFMLVNQFRLFALLEPARKDDHEWAAEVLSAGVEDQLLGMAWLNDEMDPRVPKEVDDILRMFEVIERSMKALPDPPTENDWALRFRGFDYNHDHPQVRYMDLSLQRSGYWNYLQGRKLNSHSEVLPTYRRMLRAFHPMWVEMCETHNYDLTKDQLIKLAEAAADFGGN